MNTLLLRLAGPLQAWGARSRFVHRGTEIAPTKSGVIGMLAAAKGIRRTEPLTELLDLSFAVRIDQPGTIVRDFQTAQRLDGSSLPLSYRHYLSDAVFVAAVGGTRDLLTGLHDALRRPQFPLYLGRRSCPPVLPVSLGVHDGIPVDVLRQHPWEASAWHRRTSRSATVTLEILRDADTADPFTETIRDEPVSFDPTHRQHGWRLVVREHVDLPHPEARAAHIPAHDPMIVTGG
ncbi:type I-E CRISPR-associated protein Cas5/CasD [Solwaraspora sp. WMMD791]|uniref:type I-E CRISPR-associated protein Cas5/CasD n=1 Tax=Solwaraspora sp. WMMD791 TaxID=3016086 RepID=UPI00249CF0B7|nr:type I-E CRISPR-associated protein Cas5/CasD [Solwaraspora sp. WMMD791]WFE28278.1 type I-E CRISPR-associated protein Cas5/CasD [Solwaraspora sp. WMMD791]